MKQKCKRKRLHFFRFSLAFVFWICYNRRGNEEIAMLRICNEKDCHDIWVINREEMGYDVDFEIAQKHIINVLNDDSQRIFVYEVDGRVVGYIHAATYNLLYSDPMKTILGLAVLKEFIGE